MKNVILLNNNHSNITDVVFAINLICQYSLLRSEQIATITHFNGKAILKENISEEHANSYMKMFSWYNIPVEVEDAVTNS